MQARVIKTTKAYFAHEKKKLEDEKYLIITEEARINSRQNSIVKIGKRWG